MTWKLTKIEEGINDGEVLYHSYIQKSVEEICQLRKRAPKIRFFFLTFNQIVIYTYKIFINHFLSKKKLLMEKNIEHASIRKLKNRAEHEEYQNEKLNQERKNLIQRQAEVTGDEPAEE